MSDKVILSVNVQSSLKTHLFESIQKLRVQLWAILVSFTMDSIFLVF